MGSNRNRTWCRQRGLPGVAALAAAAAGMRRTVVDCTKAGRGGLLTAACTRIGGRHRLSLRSHEAEACKPAEPSPLASLSEEKTAAPPACTCTRRHGGAAYPRPARALPPTSTTAAGRCSSGVHRDQVQLIAWLCEGSLQWCLVRPSDMCSVGTRRPCSFLPWQSPVAPIAQVPCRSWLLRKVLRLV